MTPKMTAVAKAVCTALEASSYLRIPKYLATTTFAPMERPIQNATIRPTIGTLVPTAANGLVRNKMSENSNVCKVVKLLENTGQG